MKKTKYLLIALLSSAAFDLAANDGIEAARNDFYVCGNHRDYDEKSCQKLKEFFENRKSTREEIRKKTLEGFGKTRSVSNCKMEIKQEMMEILGFFPNAILINKDEKDQCVSWESIAGISCQYYSELSAILPAHWSVQPFCEWEEDNKEIYDQYPDAFNLSHSEKKERSEQLKKASMIYEEKFKFLYKQNGAGLHY
ncbi:hypothetical protein [Pseudomonas brenneri]